MLTRRHALWAAPVAVVGAGAGLSGWMLLRRPTRASGIGGPFTLVDGSGKTVTDSSFRGKWMLIYFGYTHCPDACPTALQDMANALDMLDPAQRKSVVIVFITVDGERDTPAVMQDYVSNFAAPIVALSGSAEQIAAAAKAYRVYYGKHPTADGGYEMDHSSVIYVMNPDGDFVANFTHETAPARIAEKMRQLL
ncbi:MAG: SCO family protein [Alphaproteobacteria bacterium]|nr:MAG: SCO family protein [Alphaproteobacteria bacterium]